MRTSFLVAVAVVGLAAILSPARADHTKDTPAEVKKVIADGKAVRLDVREKDEWDDGHLKDAKLLRLNTLKGGARPRTWRRSLRKTRSSIATVGRAFGA